MVESNLKFHLADSKLTTTSTLRAFLPSHFNHGEKDNTQIHWNPARGALRPESAGLILSTSTRGIKVPRVSPHTMCVQLLSHIRLFATLWTVAHQAPLSMGYSRQEYCSGLPGPPPGDLPNTGTEPRSPTLQADSLPSEPPEKPKNTGVGSLTLLQGIFLTQESTQGLLHCRSILYQLSYLGNSFVFILNW